MTRFDVDALRRNTDLLALAGHDTALKRAGAWHAGPCPFCGGRDRFVCHLTPDGWRWLCRHCGGGLGEAGKYRDSIAYVMARERCDFKTACAYLIGQPLPDRPSVPAAPAPASSDPPPAAWQERARRLVTAAEVSLWRSSEGAAALAWLRARGLKDDTIRAAHLGYNPREAFAARAAWGLLEESHPDTGKPKRVYIPRGIIIPCEAGGALWYVKARRLPGDPLKCPACKRPVKSSGKCQSCGGDVPKYICLTGSRPAALYGADSLAGARAAVLTEGEFDALLLRQAAGDLAAVVTLGSASNPLDPARWGALLADVPRVIVTYDDDGPGKSGARELSASLGERARRVRPGAKDLTDYHQAGGRLRDWLALALSRLEARDGARPVGASTPPEPDPDADREAWPSLTAEAERLAGDDAGGGVPAQPADDMPARLGRPAWPCYTCGARAWTERLAAVGGGYFCGVCHPLPALPGGDVPA